MTSVHQRAKLKYGSEWDPSPEVLAGAGPTHWRWTDERFTALVKRNAQATEREIQRQRRQKAQARGEGGK